MNKEKEIEEMLKVLEKANEPIEYDDNECCMFVYPTQKDIAEELYDAGYGNVKQAVKEFAEKLKENFSNQVSDEVCVSHQDIDNLITELYGADTH